MSEYRILDSVELRARYVTLTDRLIATIEGHDGWRPDDLVFLDKSGRPVAWLVKALWGTLARMPATPYEDGVMPPLPMLRMANSDREQWWGLTGASETGVVDVTRIPSATIGGLRSVFPAGAP